MKERRKEEEMEHVKAALEVEGTKPKYELLRPTLYKDKPNPSQSPIHNGPIKQACVGLTPILIKRSLASLSSDICRKFTTKLLIDYAIAHHRQWLHTQLVADSNFFLSGPLKEMFKNQLQELAQRSCFNLPAYSCIREGPDHAPRFKATVIFNGEAYESPAFYSTLRQAEHAAAEVALKTLAKRGPSKALAARILDETGVYKNLLQETAHRAGLNLPIYTTIRSGPRHTPRFSCTVEIAGMHFSGDPSRTKKQAQKNAAMAAWFSLRQLSEQCPNLTSSSLELKGNETQEQVIISQVLLGLQSSASNEVSEPDHKSQWQKSTEIQESCLPPREIYPVQCHTLGCSSLSPNMPTYQICQQDPFVQQHNCLLALSVPPTIPPFPHIYPLMQSIFQPESHPYFQTTGLKPIPVEPKFDVVASSQSLDLSDHLGLSKSRSTVTIKEIQEEKGEPSERSSTALLDCLASGDTTNILDTVQECDKQKPDFSRSKIRHSSAGIMTKTEWASNAYTHSRHGSVKHRLQISSGFDSVNPTSAAESQEISRQSFRPAPPYATVPEKMRNRGPTTSIGPRARYWGVPLAALPGMRTGLSPFPPTSSFERSIIGVTSSPLTMAPSVRMRSVVPVCSTPPRKMPSSDQKKNITN